uniref:Uncharacterized protein n=1 Tax=Cajanus cajan TaxID=3821 RepID=A0A151TNK5_CAJCA|nr:hypothetical protein KK1_022262 [Cajanus cajan]
MQNLTINQPLNQLFCTGIRPPLLFNWTKNAGRLIFFKNKVRRILTQHCKQTSKLSSIPSQERNNQPFSQFKSRKSR